VGPYLNSGWVEYGSSPDQTHRIFSLLLRLYLMN